MGLWRPSRSVCHWNINDNLQASGGKSKPSMIDIIFYTLIYSMHPIASSTKTNRYKDKLLLRHPYAYGLKMRLEVDDWISHGEQTSHSTISLGPCALESQTSYASPSFAECDVPGPKVTDKFETTSPYRCLL